MSTKPVIDNITNQVQNMNIAANNNQTAPNANANIISGTAETVIKPKPKKVSSSAALSLNAGVPMTNTHAEALMKLTQVAAAPSSSFICPANEHQLQTPWTFYWLRKGGLNTNTTHETYLSNLRSLGTFNSVESFWRHYCHLRKPSHFEQDFNLALFRANLVPAWESFPTGGCWIIRISKYERFLDRLWEELLVCLVGENFQTPEVVGVLLSMKLSTCMLTVWNRDNTMNDVRFRIGERLKELLNLDEESTVEYKFFADSVKDKSTHRNATAYTYTMVEEESSN